MSFVMIYLVVILQIFIVCIKAEGVHWEGEAHCHCIRKKNILCHMVSFERQVCVTTMTR